MPLASPTVLLGFLFPWTWVISSRLLQQSAAAALTLNEGYLLTAAPPDLECGLAPLSPPAPVQLLLLTLGEAYLLMAAPPDLERGVAPLGLPVPMQPPLLGCGVAPLGRCPYIVLK